MFWEILYIKHGRHGAKEDFLEEKFNIENWQISLAENKTNFKELLESIEEVKNEGTSNK